MMVVSRGVENSLGIEDGVAGVHGSIVLSGLTNQTLLVGEGDERRGGEGTLLVGNDFDIVTLVDGNARVGGTCGRGIIISTRVLRLTTCSCSVSVFAVEAAGEKNYTLPGRRRFFALCNWRPQRTKFEQQQYCRSGHKRVYIPRSIPTAPS